MKYIFVKNVFVKNAWVRNAAGVGLLWLLLAAVPCAAFAPLSERVHTKVTGETVNVGIDIADDFSDVPLNALLHALASYPQARRFRVSWVMLSMLNGTNLTALYDRRKHSVIVYSTYTEGDNDGRTSFSGHLRFTQVREEDFQKIAAARKGDTSDWDWFNDLPKYGCRKHGLTAH